MAKYRCNLDPSVVLESEAETRNYWMRYEKRFINQATKEIRSDFQLNTMSVQDWLVVQKGVAKGQMEFPKVAGFDAYVIVHDPTLVTDLNDLKID